MCSEGRFEELSSGFVRDRLFSEFMWKSIIRRILGANPSSRLWTGRDRCECLDWSSTFVLFIFSLVLPSSLIPPNGETTKLYLPPYRFNWRRRLSKKKSFMRFQNMSRTSLEALRRSLAPAPQCWQVVSAVLTLCATIFLQNSEKYLTLLLTFKIYTGHFFPLKSLDSMTF